MRLFLERVNFEQSSGGTDASGQLVVRLMVSQKRSHCHRDQSAEPRPLSP